MRFFQIGLIASVLLVIGLTAWVIREQTLHGDTLPIYGTLDNFQLVNQQNMVFGRDSLRGHVSVVNFIFTACSQTCPVLSRQMAKIQSKTEASDRDVRLVSISVDPTRDTPERLREYGARYGANFARWVFLTGPIESIRQVVVKGFMNAMGERRASGEEPNLFEVTHGENFVILDKRGDIRAFRQAKTDEDIHGILKIIRQLEKEGAPVPQAAKFALPLRTMAD